MRNDELSEDEWTPDELAQLEALDAGRAPPDMLKQRTVEALRARGLLRGRRPITPWFVAVLAAAAVVVFMAGTAVGYAAGARRAATPANDGRATPSAVAQIDSAAAGTGATRKIIWF